MSGYLKINMANRVVKSQFSKDPSVDGLTKFYYVIAIYSINLSIELMP